jgi:hypothetical protein
MMLMWIHHVRPVWEELTATEPPGQPRSRTLCTGPEPPRVLTSIATPAYTCLIAGRGLPGSPLRALCGATCRATSLDRGKHSQRPL